MSAAQYSIRRRMIWGTFACMVAIFGAIGVAVNDVARHESEEIFSARLATSARVLEALVAHQLSKATISNPVIITLPRELDHASDDTPQEVGHPYETKLAFQVWHDDGTLLAKSSSAPDTALAPLHAGFSTNQTGSDVWQVFTLHSGDVWVLAAEQDEIRQELADYLSLSILGPLVAGGLLMLLVVNLVLSFNMRPLRELASRISKREPESLALIELPQTSVELSPIINEINHLLQRVKAAFEREQLFIDSAAHEIRTPIAALQLHVQNALTAPTAAERDNSLRHALTGVQRTSRLADQLLAFSRVAAKSDQESLQTVSLTQICCDVISLQEPVLAQRGQSIGLEAGGKFEVLGAPYKLQRLLQNLVDNASRYGAPRGEILIKIEYDESMNTVLSVANDGTPIPEREVGRIFTPYYRISENDAAGAGLGLAIVKEIAEQHHARIEITRKSDNQGAVVRIIFASATVP